MKQIIRYRFFSISGKMSGEVRISLDNKQVEYTSIYDSGSTTSLSLFPFITLSIIRPKEIDENGNRIASQWNPNDSLIMSKFTFPIFIREINAIYNDMKIPEMYSYTGSRLDINNKEAEKARRVFMIANTTVELIPVIIEQLDDTRIEGIKMKFNNEQSSIGLTINELDALVYNINHLDVDSLALQMYTNYANKNVYRNGINTTTPHVDITPKEFV